MRSQPSGLPARTTPREGDGHPRYGSIAQYAVEYGVCTKTVRRWIAAGLIHAVRVGPRLIRVDLNETAGLVAEIPAARARQEYWRYGPD